MLEAILSSEASDEIELSFKSVWLQNQILKTLYQRGHYLDVLTKVEGLVTVLSGSEDPEMVYFRTKFIYLKAKTLRKTRQF